MVFSSNRHGPHFKLYSTSGTEGSVHRLTHGPGDDVFARVAPDGERIVFASNRDGGWRLYLIQNFDDSSPVALGDPQVDAIHPAWSPDGTAIAYSRRSPTTEEWEVWILDLESLTATRVTEGLFPEFRPPRGDLLLFQRSRNRDGAWYSIWTSRLDGTRQREIVSGMDWGAVNPSWSPDGATIAFNTVGKSSASRGPTASEGDDIYTVEADGTNRQRLTLRATPEWNPGWLGDRIYFSARQNGQTSIWSVAAPSPPPAHNR